MPQPALVQLRNIQKKYRLGETEVHALRGLSFDVKKGDFTAVVGASGSGKSTLLNIIGCIDDPDTGEVIFDDVNVGQLSDVEKSILRNQKIGFIFQSFNLIPVLTVYENIELPLLIQEAISKSERHERVLAALEDVGISKFIQYLPDKLSGGQRQRVAIARALITSPSLVLADEPTANLDSDTTHKIIDLMMTLNGKKHVTFLFSTHDEKLIGRVSRTARIQDGIIVG